MVVITENTLELFLGTEVGCSACCEHHHVSSDPFLQFLKIYSSRKQSSLKILSDNSIKQKHMLPVHCFQVH